MVSNADIDNILSKEGIKYSQYNIFPISVNTDAGFLRYGAYWDTISG